MGRLSKAGQSKRGRFLRSGGARNYMKYSGLAFQIAVYVIAGLWLGRQVDKYLDMQRPVFSGVLAALFLIAFFFKLFAELGRR